MCGDFKEREKTKMSTEIASRVLKNTKDLVYNSQEG